MAYAQIVDADTKNGVVSSNSASWTLTYPTNLVSGDLILGLAGIDGTTGSSSIGFQASGFAVSRATQAGAVSLHAYAKISDGTETGTFAATLNASESGGWRIFRITGWFGSGIIASAGSGTQIDANGMSMLSAIASSSNPNPPALDPANWATEDVLWIAACALDTSRTISVYPLAGRNTADNSGGSGGATLGICTSESAVGSLDPGTFTISASDDWVAATIAIRPAAGGGGGGGDIFVPYVNAGYYPLA